MIISDKEDEVIEEFLRSLLSKYQIGLRASMKVSDRIFDSVHLNILKMSWNKF